MYRLPIDLLEKPFDLLYADIYLFDSSGKIISSRESSAYEVDNILNIISDDGRKTLSESLKECYMYPLTLVDSHIGPMLINTSLFAKYGLMVAIVAHFSREETIAIAQKYLQSRVRIAHSLIKNSELIDSIELTDEQTVFAKRILAMHRPLRYYDVHGKTNGDLASMICDVVMDTSVFYGCKVIASIEGIGAYELSKSFCVDSYMFSLTLCLLAARKYSSSRDMKMKICFDPIGISLEISFLLADCLGDAFEFGSTQEIVKLNVGLQRNGGLYELKQNGREVILRIFPWVLEPDSSDLKKKEVQFIY
jgi:hypothetical protein